MVAPSRQPYSYETSLQQNDVANPYSEFTSPAETQKSFTSLSTASANENRPRRNGPYVNFDQQPESYELVDGAQIQLEPMPANTKRNIKAIRGIQLGLRVVQGIVALGLLTCGICLKEVGTSVSWIFRVAPAWDALVTIYAIYHLARQAKSRPPAASASYHMFAFLMDASMLLFYVFIAVVVHSNYELPEQSHARWKSLFATDQDTTLVLLATFAGSVGIGSFHAISGALDWYLIVAFKKISMLPPDMNPLEDNLTARPSRASKHKYKNSDATLTNESWTDKEWKHLSDSTLAVDYSSQRSSPEVKSTEQGKSGFSVIRTDTVPTLTSPYPNIGRRSRHHHSSHRARRNSDATRDEQHDLPPIPERSPCRPAVHPSAQKAATSKISESPYGLTPRLPKIATTDSLLKDNWYVLEDENSGSRTAPREVEDVSPIDQDEQHPLRMNPPSQPNSEKAPEAEDDAFIDQSHKRAALVERGDKGNAVTTTRNLTTQSASGKTEPSSVYSESAPSLKTSQTPRKIKESGTPKGKYYGDLSAATLGVRGKASNHSLLAHTTDFDATGMSAGHYGFSSSPPPEKMMRGSPKKESKVRVISRSGADIADQAQYPYNISQGMGMRERRDVSGKVAEEGRAGGWFGRAR